MVKHRSDDILLYCAIGLSLIGLTLAQLAMSHWILEALVAGVIGLISCSILLSLRAHYQAIVNTNAQQATIKDKVAGYDSLCAEVVHQFREHIDSIDKTLIQVQGLVSDAAKKLSGLLIGHADTEFNHRDILRQLVTELLKLATDNTQSRQNEGLRPFIEASGQALQCLVETVQTTKASDETLGLHFAAMQDKIRSKHQILAEVPQINQQIELLALNAAIEAACHVERGHGFAAVVNEVRKLAQRTETFDHQIGSWLRDVNRAIEEVYHAVEASISLDISEADISQNTMKATLDSLQNHNELTMQRSRQINGISEDVHRLVLEGILSAQFEDKVTQILAILRSQFQLISDSSTDFFKVHGDADISDSVLR